MPDEPNLPIPPDAAQRPQIGVDSWVASHGERVEVPGSWRARLAAAFASTPLAARLLGLAAIAATLPLLTDSDYVIRVGVDTILYILLALGLNVVVGWSGLLDLGYVAFYGFGAYLYAILASDHFDIHWPAQAVVPIVVVAAALLGLLLGWPSWRLHGDYLAIVTLFFLQIFITLVTNSNRLNIPFRDEPIDFTGGVNGIPDVDAFRLFGYEFESNTQYYFLGLGTAVLVLGALYLLNESRTGRAWRALREDPLAAEMMTIPVNRLKLMAFSFGAAVAGLTGTIFAPVHTGVFPTNFDLTLLIIVYAMVILGGAGSLAGVALGAIVIQVSLEALTDQAHARWLFYGVILLLIIAVLRPWTRPAVLLGGTLAFGFFVHEVVGRIWERGLAGATTGDDWVTRALEHWVLLPSNPTRIGDYAFIALVAAVLVLTLLRGWWRIAGMIPTLYLAAFVWENLLVAEPSVTRLILLGALLVALMNARPQGLLGSARVEIA